MANHQPPTTNHQPPSICLYSPYIDLTREEWSRLRNSTPLTLAEDDWLSCAASTSKSALREVEDIYLPLSRLLNLYVDATQKLHKATSHLPRQFDREGSLRHRRRGSVAVGKSTTARVLQALLARWPNHPKVDLVTTDGFLFPNAVLEARGLMKRKGFPKATTAGAWSNSWPM